MRNAMTQARLAWIRGMRRKVEVAEDAMGEVSDDCGKGYDVSYVKHSGDGEVRGLVDSYISKYKSLSD